MTIRRHHDGDGREIKRGDIRWNYDTEEWFPEEFGYMVRSSVLGGAIVTEVGPTGKKEQTYVFAGGAIARQKIKVVSGTPQEKVA